jgi:hypothetical protein
MNYLQNNTLPEIATYGRSLGDSLGQAMYAVPQQRAQIAMQLAQARQQQQQAMLEYALKQQGQQQQQQYQQGELGVQQGELAQHKLEAAARLQEMKQADEMHRINAEAAKMRATNEAKGTWKLGETKAGKPYKINTLSGEISWLPTEDAGGPSAMASGVPGQPMTQNQNLQNLDKLGRLAAVFQQTGMNTNLPSVFSSITNRLAQLGGLQGQGQGQGQTTTPVTTNAAPVAQLGGMTYPVGTPAPAWAARPVTQQQQQVIPYDQWLKQ